jgi:hypothetical protein
MLLKNCVDSGVAVNYICRELGCHAHAIVTGYEVTVGKQGIGRV